MRKLLDSLETLAVAAAFVVVCIPLWGCNAGRASVRPASTTAESAAVSAGPSSTSRLRILVVPPGATVEKRDANE